jgi:sugar-specific transcriptional regulator TrmB
MKYDKGVSTKKNRLLSVSGPRDIQRRQILSAQSDLVDDLKTQVVMLQEQVGKNLSAVSSDGKYTADQVNETVISAVKSEVDSLKSKYESRIKELETENKILRETNIRLSSRPEGGNNLTEDQLQKMISTAMIQVSDNKQVEIVEETTRPKIETLFIDPSESGTTNDVEICITTKEDNSAKENMNDKINKLKGILGSLPKTK